MSELRLIRKRCPHCGKAMRPDETGRGGERYSAPPARRSAARPRRPKMGGQPAAPAGQVASEESGPWRRGRLSIRLPFRVCVAIQPAVGHPLPATGLAG
jgi:hypothetical protein